MSLFSVKSKVFTEVKMWIVIVWVKTPFNLAGGCQSFHHLENKGDVFL
jgi:hypothetical protein